ncbi:MAG: peptidylprolyl isomerase, partial [Planctomycetales bacterium]|nr:peptidylprolyl isomerase [Planctomycetales bacterium]
MNVGDSPFAASERAASAAAARDMHPSVVFKTSLGDVTVKLDGEKAPLTVDNFLNNYVRHGYYTNTIFHYVAP